MRRVSERPGLRASGSRAGVALAALFALAVVGLVAAMWRSRRVGGSYLRSGYDIAYDPVGDPGLAAKERWEKAVSRLPDGKDEEEEDG